MQDGPFRPRMRPRAFLRTLRPRRGPPGGFDVVAVAAFALVLFGFWRVFSVLDGQDAAAGSAGAMRAGGDATTWLVVTVGAAGVLAWSMHRRREPAVTLKRRKD